MTTFIQQADGHTKHAVVVSTFPPTRCGIGSYGAQLTDDLSKKGYTVTTVSVNPEGNANAKLNLLGGIRCLRLIPYLINCDFLIFNYHRSFFFRSRKDTIFTNLTFCLLFLIFGKKISVICHEVEFLSKTGSLKDKLLFKFEETRWLLTSKICFHTQRELENFVEYYQFNRRQDLSIVPHGQHFKKYTNSDQESARKALNLDMLSPKAKIFLCIGFIQPSKGFDRAINIFNQLDIPENNYLYIVGSLRLELEESVDYLNYLKRKSAKNDCIRIIDKFITDEEFDTWISAADFILLPYRVIWSSGVAERAKLFQKPRIVSDVGGLKEQILEIDYLFKTEEDLSEIIAGLLK